MIGTRLGPYEITAKLGEGGMGEVYKATDSHLGREVALKVLPEAFTADPERTARFEREAKLLASLNHPNIAQIYGLETSGESRALVMELVEGPTLAERLESGPLPIDEALLLARQIAEALEQAHGRGIIHRDLKPQNIKAPREGNIKVLDFGLAKAMDPSAASGIGAASASQLAASPTLTLGATQMGLVLGTAAYMSPEQAKGLAVDKRADIWAFGVVLYEMLTGGRLFDGDSVPETLAGVLKNPIDPEALLPNVPPAIRRLLRRCLERSPKNRLHDIADARIVIDEAIAGGDEPRDAAPASPASPRAPQWLPWTVAGLFAVVALALVVARPESRGEAAPAAMTRTSVLSARAGDSEPLLGGFAIAPDGTAVVFLAPNAEGRIVLWLRELAEEEPRALDGTVDAEFPFWSADSRHVAYFAGGFLRRVARSGGAVQTICAAKNGRGGAWSENGTIVFAPDPYSPLLRVNASGGEPVAATELDAEAGERSHRFPQFLPGGESFLFGVEPWEENFRLQVKTASLDAVSTGKPLLLASAVPRFAPPDQLVLVRDEALLAQTIDLDRLETIGDPKLLSGRPEVVADTSSAPVVDLSSEGKMLYAQFDARPTAFTWLGRDGSRRGEVLRQDGVFFFPSISRAGDRLAVIRRERTERRALWVYELASGRGSRITPADLFPFATVWAPGDREIAMQISVGASSSRNALSLVAVDSGQVRRLQEPSDLWIVPGDLTPDGGTLVYQTLTAGNGLDLGSMSVEQGAERTPYLATAANESSPKLSPDGRWIAYLSDASGKPEAYVDTFPIPTHARRVPVDGAALEPFFRSDGRELFLFAAESEGAAVFAYDLRLGEDLEIGRARKLFDLPPETSGVAPAPMGDRFLVLQPVGSRAPALTLVDHWQAQLGGAR
jgi:Tol biopolymer transport system component